jgi:hypothetical protein
MAWVIPALVIGIGVISCTTFFFLYRHADTWPSVSGSIEGLVEIRSLDSGSGRGPYYGVVSYSYEVSGEYYSGIWRTPDFPRRQQVTDFFSSRIPAGTQIVVHYYPRKPSRSMLNVDWDTLLKELDPNSLISLNLNSAGPDNGAGLPIKNTGC